MISNIGSSGEDGVRFVAPPRDAASGLPTGKRQHKPMVITTPDLTMSNHGAALQLEATGHVNGKPGTSFGKLNLVGDGNGAVRVVPNFLSRGGPGTVRLRVYEDPQNEGENPLYEGSIASETTGPNGTPLCFLRFGNR
ncbi:MAG: hypothetical protein GY953_53130, partial [bacterium]|nr:hypothetical protein [bacterium]